MSNDSFIQISHVSKTFGPVRAVSDVTLDIREGEVFCLLGGSGSGKSTLLRMLAGFEAVSSGSIHIDGQNTSGCPPEKLPVNMMFQSYALFPHMSVYNNIAYGLKREGVARAEIKERVNEALAMVKLEAFANRKPSQLSGGQRQRVALARCIVKRPKVLLLDEPLGALDKKLREETQQELLKIQKELGLTFIVVTHDQEEAMNLANRIGIMDHGRIVQVGTPGEIYEQPNSLFVADFVGALNRIDGTYVDHAGPTGHVDIGDGVILEAEGAAQFAVGTAVTAIIRPEHVFVHAAGQGGTNSVSGTVSFVNYLGSQTTYTIALSDGREVRANAQNTRHHGGIRAQAGDRVDLLLSAEDVRLFAQSGDIG